jgi:hypothetical protein
MRHPLPPLAIAVATAAAVAATAAACGSSGKATTAPPVTVTVVVPSATPTSAPTSTPSPTPSPSSTPTQPKPTPAPIPAPVHPTLSAVQVVDAYYAAINAHDYRTAWNLGGFNFVSNFDTFAKAFAGTATDLLTVTGSNGDVVSIRLDAVQTDGSVKLYQGTYTARDGHLVGANIQQIGTIPAP